MKVHFKTWCTDTGRNYTGGNSTNDVQQVTCKTCLKRLPTGNAPPVHRPLATPDQEHFYQFLKDVTI